MINIDHTFKTAKVEGNRQCDFTVTSSYEFPWDMLRYDQCFPASTDDAMKMTQEGKRTIRLRCHNHLGIPTVDRWRSFGWSVLAYEGH